MLLLSLNIPCWPALKVIAVESEIAEKTREEAAKGKCNCRHNTEVTVSPRLCSTASQHPPICPFKPA